MRLVLVVPFVLSMLSFVGCADTPDEADEARSTSPPLAIPAIAGVVSPRALAAAMPDGIAELRASDDVQTALAPGLAPTARATRSYTDGDERRAVLRIIDAARAPELIAGFAAAQQLVVPAEPGEDELLPTGIAGRPALASWSPSTRVSEAQMLVSERFIVALSVAPARTEDEAVVLLEAIDLRALESLSR